MKSRAFMVDVTVTYPKGGSVEDWAYIGHLMQDVNEDDLPMSLYEVYKRLGYMIQEWQDTHKDEHDCLDNAKELFGGYFCEVCEKNVTKEVRRLVKLSSERKIHARARDIRTD